MSASRLTRAAFFVAVGCVLGIRAVAAQDSACTYVRCALRVEHQDSPFEPARLVQGLEARPVATLGLFAPRISLLELSPDSVRRPYLAFRHNTNTSGALWVLGAVAAVSSGFFWGQASHGHPAAMFGLIGAGAALSLTAMIERGRAVADLGGAIRRYNEALPEAH